MSRVFFEQVVEALVGFLLPDRRRFSSRVTSRNAKVWFGTETREHYEVQVLRRDRAHVLELGFHAEHADSARSEDVVARLLSAERGWRRSLGPEVEIGPAGRCPAPRPGESPAVAPRSRVGVTT